MTSARKAAREAGEKTYIGKPCPRGHTRRYTRNCSCVECDQAAYWAAQEYANAYHRVWRRAHLDHARAAGRERQERYRRRHAAARLTERTARKAARDALHPLWAVRKAECDAERDAVWVNTIRTLYYEA